MATKEYFHNYYLKNREKQLKLAKQYYYKNRLRIVTGLRELCSIEEIWKNEEFKRRHSEGCRRAWTKERKIKMSIVHGGDGIHFSWLKTYPCEYERIRKSILERDNYKCEECGSLELLHVHHKDSDKTNNSMNNLVTLCRDCHNEFHINKLRGMK